MSKSGFAALGRLPVLVAIVALLVSLGGVSVSAQTTTNIEPIRIEEIQLQQSDSGAEMVLRADGPLVWTQYRDAASNLVVELPNTLLGSEVGDLTRDSGLVEMIEVLSEANGDRPLTKIVVRTRYEAEHSLEVNDSVLSVSLSPAADQMTSVPSQPIVPPATEGIPQPAAADVQDDGLVELPMEEETVADTFEPDTLEEVAFEETDTLEEMPLETEVADSATYTTPSVEEASVASLDDQAAMAALASMDYGTADNPAVAPAPMGSVANSLIAVAVDSTTSGDVVRVSGDGEFAYSTFVLDNPPRFVIDLNGVVNTSGQSVVPVSGNYVDQVRMAQFSPHPNPVSRVVFDLGADAMPIIERDSSGLAVRFVSRPAAMQEQPMQVAQAAPVNTFEEDTMEETTFEPVETAPETAEQYESHTFETPSNDAETTFEVVEAEPVEEEWSETDEWEPEQPLQIAQESSEAPAPPAFEPTTSNVELYEAQDVEIATPQQTTSAAEDSTFGVQPIGAEREYQGEPITMSLKDADITEVLRSIARLSNLNIVIQPGVSGPVTVELDRVPWDQALDQILKINGLGMQLEGNILRIAPTSQLEEEARQEILLAQAKALSVPLKTVLRRVSYARASVIAGILTSGQRNQVGASVGNVLIGNPGGILSQRGSISVDDRTNTLIIQELPDYLDTVLQVISNIDIPEKQVMIEARIVETTRNFSRSLGIDWQIGGVSSREFGNTTGLQFPNNIAGTENRDPSQATSGVQLLTGGANAFLDIGFGNVLNTFELDITLQAAENDGLVNVISAPKIATLNNERASIQSGIQLPVQTTANNTITVQYVNATLRLDVTPQVTSEGTILMQVDVQKREPQSGLLVTNAANTPIATREASTRVIVRDGGTAVIGGIYQVAHNRSQDRVPGLSNIPLLGHLFKNRSRSNQNEELLIFVTPRVIQL